MTAATNDRAERALKIEVVLQAGYLVLTETARDTLRRCLASTLALVGETTAALLHLWQKRRASLDLLLHPKLSGLKVPPQRQLGSRGIALEA